MAVVPLLCVACGEDGDGPTVPWAADTFDGKWYGIMLHITDEYWYCNWPIEIEVTSGNVLTTVNGVALGSNVTVRNDEVLGWQCVSPFTGTSGTMTFLAQLGDGAATGKPNKLSGTTITYGHRSGTRHTGVFECGRLGAGFSWDCQEIFGSF